MGIKFHFNHGMIRNIADERGSSQQANDFWGMAIFEAESFEKVAEVFSDPEFLRIIPPDEKVVFDLSKTLTFAGNVATIFEQTPKKSI